MLKHGGAKTSSVTSILACYYLHKQDSERSYEWLCIGPMHTLSVNPNQTVKPILRDTIYLYIYRHTYIY